MGDGMQLLDIDQEEEEATTNADWGVTNTNRTSMMLGPSSSSSSSARRRAAPFSSPLDFASEIRRLRLVATVAAVVAVLLVAYHLSSAVFGGGGGGDGGAKAAARKEEAIHVTFGFENGTLWSDLEGFWTSWSSWTPCSVSCGGGGSRLRFRDCAGGACVGNRTQEERGCGMGSCARWSLWTEWTPCPSRCGDHSRTRDRICIAMDSGTTPSPLPSSSSPSSPPPAPPSCPGQRHEVAPCPIEDRELTNGCEGGSWSDWSDWSGCSSGCDPGTRGRERSCQSSSEETQQQGYICQEDMCYKDDCECKATLSSMSGIVKSKNYPNNYPHNQNCIYHIVLGKGYQIQVNITGISLESHSNCNYDYLKVEYYRESGGTYEVAKLCGRITSTKRYTLRGNRAKVTFRTDVSTSGSGFFLTYQAIPPSGRRRR